MATDADNVLKFLTCPVEYKPLYSAVSLIPCCHKINEAMARQLFGLMHAEHCERPALCPLCRRTIVAYYADPFVCELARTVFRMVETTRPLILAQVPLAAASLGPILPFPGKRARFVWQDGNWDSDMNSGGPLVRQLIFRSAIPGSLFSKLYINGYDDRKIAICLYFDDGDGEGIAKKRIRRSKRGLAPERSFASPSGERLRRYFESGGVVFEQNDYDLGYLQTTGNPEFSTVFRMVAENNEIPEKYIPLLRALAEAGRW